MSTKSTISTGRRRPRLISTFMTPQRGKRRLRPIANIKSICSPAFSPVPSGGRERLHRRRRSRAAYVNRPEFRRREVSRNPFSRDPTARSIQRRSLGRYDAAGISTSLDARNQVNKKKNFWIRGCKIELGKSNPAQRHQAIRRKRRLAGRKARINFSRTPTS